MSKDKGIYDIINAILAIITEDRKWKIHAQCARVSDMPATIAKISKVTTLHRPYPTYLEVVLDGPTVLIGSAGGQQKKAFDLNNPDCFRHIKAYLAEYE
jgi:hypothetical protein